MTDVAGRIWPYIARSIERLIVVAFDDLDADGRSWRPRAPKANSVLALVNHTISNAEDNLLGTILGRSMHYDRQIDFDSPAETAQAVRDRWADIRRTFEEALPSLDDARLIEAIQHPRRGSITRFDVLIVVARHAAEHLGQAELTRDLYRAAH